jgi:hypothetical protein
MQRLGEVKEKMKITFSKLMSTALVVAFLASALLINIHTSSNASNYDPWYDINGDGKIDIKDATLIGLGWQAQGDPTRNVNITNTQINVHIMPKANVAVNFAANKHVGFGETHAYEQDMTKFAYFHLIANCTLGDGLHVRVYFVTGGVEHQTSDVYVSAGTCWATQSDVYGEIVKFLVTGPDDIYSLGIYCISN